MYRPLGVYSELSKFGKALIELESDHSIPRDTIGVRIFALGYAFKLSFAFESASIFTFLYNQ